MYLPILILLASLGKLLYAGHAGAPDTIRLENGELVRELRIGPEGVSSTRLSVEGSAHNLISGSRDFFFLLNDSPVDGSSDWSLESVDTITGEHSGKGIRLVLMGENELGGLILKVNYMLYEGSSVMRKWLIFTNRSAKDLKLEAVNVEDLQTTLSPTHTVVLHNYGRMKHLGSFIGNWHDPVVVLHHQPGQRGLAVGNEAPGVMKRTAYHTRDRNLEAGLTHPGQDFPFRMWLEPGETWETPKTFVCPYEGLSEGFSVIDGEVNDFVRRHVVPQIVKRADKPVFVYNTWNPFRTFVSDSLVREVARAAARCGVMEFIIDDGWQVNTGSATSPDAWGNNYGDWNVDTVKFPGGFHSTFEYIDSLGMKPGIWMSIGSATSDARVFREHPEWFVKNRSGEFGNLHSMHDDDFHTSCFGTGWMDYIGDIISSMVREYGLAYTKLDFAVVTSAYVNDPAISGCYATGHPLHRDHRESLLVNYERVLELFDRLHRESPELFIDCTFETAGKLQLMDYAIALHADGNWLANFEEPSPAGPLRIRQMAWWRTPAVPASSLVIGNTRMDDPGFELALKSLIGTLPIVLGDPRELSEAERERIRKWSLWMQEMQNRYDYMSYRRDLPGFGEPAEGSWDGWMRINNDTDEGGIVGVFRHGALEQQRRVFLKGLDPSGWYAVRLAPSGDLLMKASGEFLMESGFPVEIPGLYDGKIFEIGLIL